MTLCENDFPDVTLSLATLEEYTCYIDQIYEAANQMKSLANDLMNLNKPIESSNGHESEESDGHILLSSHIVNEHLKTIELCSNLSERARNFFEVLLEEGENNTSAVTESTVNEDENDESLSISSESVDSNEIDIPIDVIPVSGAEAETLNHSVIKSIEAALDHDATRIAEFKARAMQFGKGISNAADFYGFLESQMSPLLLGSIIIDFARLLPIDDRRVPLLEEHAKAVKMLTEKKISIQNPPSQIPTTPQIHSFSDLEDFPSHICLDTINHLIFVIHGIGQHVDFKDGELKSWDGNSGLEGGNFTFRNLFRTMIRNQFKDIPISLEIQSIEWHEDLHCPTGVDNVFEMICPEGSTSLREYTKDTLMDVLYYFSAFFGQMIIDTVTQQLNSKYKVFMEEHPGWNGKISIFAHSLGSVIAYDVLTHPAGSKGRNGVVFPGIDFEVENLFAAGSPVPIFILSRGDLNITDGNFQPGIKMPNCKRVFNIFHPIDPIAFRIEPLIKPEMEEKNPVPLIPANSMKDFNFIKLQEKYEHLSAPLHGIQRMDYVMKRRKREGMIEMAYALSSHSSYWESEDVVLFILLQICRPVVQILQRYKSAQRRLPHLSRPIGILTPISKVNLTGTCLIRESCTGFWYEKTIVMDSEWVHLFPSSNPIMCKKRGSIPLCRTTRIEYDDSPFALNVTCDELMYILKASSTESRDDWYHTIKKVVSDIRPGNVLLRKMSSSIILPSDHSIEYFGAIKCGYLNIKGQKGWLDGFKSRWIVLHEDRIDYFESSPVLDSSEQIRLRNIRVFSFPKRFLFRLLSPSGEASDIRVKPISVFKEWLQYFETLKTVQIINCDDVVSNSPSEIVLIAKESQKSKAPNSASGLQIRIEGHRILFEQVEKGASQYAAFVLHVKFENGSSHVVQRRFSEIRKLHLKLREVFPHEKVPPLPHTRLWNKLDNKYLMQKSVLLQGYLAKICILCSNNRGYPILVEFLSDDRKSRA